MSRITDVTRWEGAEGSGGSVNSGGPTTSTESTSARRRWRIPGAGRLWLIAWILVFSLSVGSWLVDGPVVHFSGWPMFVAFFSAALTPELSPDFLLRTLDATLTTLSYAVLGTLLAVAVGLVIGVLVSQVWWSGTAASRRSQAAGRIGWTASRLGLALPRGLHEAVWALLLVSVLGRDPLVGILAIAIPFGAITAKVYAEILDDTVRAPYEALRAAGCPRLPALLYAVVPAALPDMVSYAFYRFECSVRSAVILGMVGAGGLGFELVLSFSGSRHGEVWTLIIVLVLIGAVVDRWSAGVRRRGGTRLAVIVSTIAIAGSLLHLGPGLARLFSGRTAAHLLTLAQELVPPRLPAGGWPRLWEETLETLQMAIVAGTLAGVAAVVVAFLAARGGTTRVRRLVSSAARWLLLVTRSLPPPVWALLMLFLLLPGPLPGALALAVYNFGILGRLCSEVVENLDGRPHALLTAGGAPPLSAFAYGTVPMAAPRFLSYALYRWEVATRETVIVGVVGAGGLGRLLEDQRVAFDLGGMAGTILALIASTIFVDVVSTAVRRSFSA